MEKFRSQQASYTDDSYNETEVRSAFLNPLFRLLGWPVGEAPSGSAVLRDVVQEATVVVDGRTKFPDYAFRLGGREIFFVEAKKPSEDIAGNRSHAYQTRSYGWSAKHPLTVLTDFEEFALYDTRVPPKPEDDADERRICYIRFGDYADKWDKLAGLLSRDAVRDGRFAAFAENLPAIPKRKLREVDDDFLDAIEAWRKMLAVDMAAHNPSLTERELRYAVQATIDRLVFLRICEDRELEPAETLKGLLSGENVYDRLQGLLIEADQRYNSGLFHFSKERGRKTDPDELTPGLSVSDDVLKTVVSDLYNNPYSFSVLPADILGQVYERFLGKAIRLPEGPGGPAVVEWKPENLKDLGVYYTPTHIVDYIVKRTVGELLKDRKVLRAGYADRRLNRPLRVLDPACGSGSFLLGAYQYLLDWYLVWYTSHDPAALAAIKSEAGPPVREAVGGGWVLTTAERKRILTAHMFGVDVDDQAVEVAKLSLLLKVLEGGVDDTPRLFADERLLPDLSANIRCGNSLIGTDFESGLQGDLLDLEERLRVNAFDWEKVGGFPDAMSAGGFDAVIGNPPYVFGEYHDDLTKPYIERQFDTASSQYDTFWLFTETAVRLAGPESRLALIVPDALLARDGGAKVRKLILDAGLSHLYHCGQVFNAGVSAVVFVCDKNCAETGVVAEVRAGFQPELRHVCSKDRFTEERAYAFLIHANDAEDAVLRSLSDGAGVLGALVKISRGEETGKKSVMSTGPVPILVGEDISRYSVHAPTRFVQSAKKAAANYSPPKIVFVKTGARGVATYDAHGWVTMQSVYNIRVKGGEGNALCLLGILNSRLFQFVVQKTFTDYKLLFPQLNQSTIEGVPAPKGGIHTPDLERAVRQMLQLSDPHAPATPQARTTVRRQIEANDRKIDQFVYDLYKLTADEVALVEAATAKS